MESRDSKSAKPGARGRNIAVILLRAKSNRLADLIPLAEKILSNWATSWAAWFSVSNATA